MGITTEQYDKIIRFLDARMESEEMDEFENDLASNPEMQQQLEFEQSLRDDFTLHKINILAGTNEGETPKTTGMQKWWTIAAAVVAIIALTLFAKFWQKPVNTQDVANKKGINLNRPQVSVTPPAKDSSKVIDLASLFKQYFRKDDLPENYPLFLAEAFTDYESDNYSTLQRLDLNNIPQTRGIDEPESKDDILKLGHYYKGLAFLQTNNTKEAAKNFDWVLNNKPGKALLAKAQWYLALTYLKENNGERAAELCKNIISNKEDSVLGKNAEKILDTLGK